jgi:hypothetical protein
MGANAAPEKGKLYLDTGNRLAMGMIDHHQFSRETCTTRLALDHREQYLDFLSNAEEVEVILHEYPCFDCIAALFVVDALLNKRAISEEVLQKLADYTLDIDMGRIEEPDIECPSLYYILMSQMDMLAKKFGLDALPGDSSVGAQHPLFHAMVKKGLETIDHYVALVQSNTMGSFKGNGVCLEDPFFNQERQYLKDDYEKYIADLNDYTKVNFIATRALLKNVNISEMADVLVYRNPSCNFFKIWARHDRVHAPSGTGFQVLLVIWCNGATHWKRYVMSTEPTGRYCLRFLGDVLNFHEQRKRSIEGRPQQGANRPGYDLPDPWYDGRSHNYTIVDTPHDGTALSEDEIISLFSNFYTEHIFLNTNLKTSRINIIIPLKIPDAHEFNITTITDAGFRSEAFAANERYFFRSAFTSMFYPHDHKLGDFTKPVDQRRHILFTQGDLSYGFDVHIKEHHIAFFKNLMLYSVQLQLEETNLYTVQSLVRFLSSLDVQGKPLAKLSEHYPYLFADIQGLHPGFLPVLGNLFVHASLMCGNFHSFRETQFSAQIINSFLAGEESSVPLQLHTNELIKFTDYYHIGINNRIYLAFQNIYDPRLSQPAVKDLYEFDQKNYFHIFLFALLRRTALDDFTDRFSRLDLINMNRAIEKKSRALLADVLDYINTIHLLQITNDQNGMLVFKKMLDVNAIPESFEEMHTSLRQLINYNEQRLQRKQNAYMDSLQLIFLIGVAASVMSLGAMPGAKIFTYDAANKLIGTSDFVSFDLLTLLVQAPIAIFSAGILYVAIKAIFNFFKKS